MTILTKPFGEAKKSEKSILPLVGGSDVPPVPTAPSVPRDDESAASSIILIRRARRFSSATTYILFLIALLVTSLGIITGVFYYRQYAHSRNHLRFHGFCQIPYDSSSVNDDHMFYMNSMLHDDNDGDNSQMVRYQQIQDLVRPWNRGEERVEDTDKEVTDQFFKEEFELGLSDDDNYSKINVPVFRGQRQGRFLHDFKYNQSGIIDKENGRCFLMPLDRETVLPPKSLRDLIEKMWNGYYNIDTSTVRKNMRVITPELNDLSDVSPRITSECEDMKIYRLEKLISGVFKRSADLHQHAKFAEFGGNHISVIDIQNLEDIAN